MTTKNARSLDSIAVEIHKLDRVNIFEKGDLLREAKASCEHGTWLAWLRDEFESSEDTAGRLIAVAELGTRFRKLRNLALPRTVLYELAAEAEEDLPAIIEELAKRTKTGRIKIGDTLTVFAIGRARGRHGPHPDATLLFLDGFEETSDNAAWHPQAVAALKSKNPESEDDAEKIIADIAEAYDSAEELAHVTELFASCGTLPEVPADSLGDLEDIAAEHRAQVLELLVAEPQPLTAESVTSVIARVCSDGDDDEDAGEEDDGAGDDGGDDDGAGDDAGSDKDEAPPVSSPAPLPEELRAALSTILHYARRPRPTAVGGITGPELMEITDFLQHLYDTIHGGGGDVGALCGDLAQLGLKIATAPSKRALFVAYLNHQDSEKRVTVVNRTGWCNLPSGKVYVLPDRTIGNTGSETVIFVGAQSTLYAAKGTLEKWCDTIGKLAAGHKRVMLCISTALAATVAELVGAESGGIHLYGRSSTGKTTAADAAASVFGRGDEKGFVRTWRHTANGLEGAAMLHNDAPLPLDEIGVGDPREIGAVIYSLCGGVGKGRAARDGSLRASHTWRSLIISTGEMRVIDKIVEGGKRPRAGQEVRIVDIPADDGKEYGVFDHGGPNGDAGRLADEIKAAARTYYGTAGPAFVEALLAEGLDVAVQQIKAAIAEFRQANVADSADGQVKRVADRFAFIGAAGELAIKFKIVPWGTGSAVSAAVTLFQVWLDTRGGTEPTEVRNMISQVRGLIERFGSSRFDSVLADPERRPAFDRLGWHRGTGEDSEWLIPPETWRTQFCAGYDPTTVARILCDRGMLKRAENQFSCSEWIDGKTNRVYVLTARITSAESTLGLSPFRTSEDQLGQLGGCERGTSDQSGFRSLTGGDQLGTGIPPHENPLKINGLTGLTGLTGQKQATPAKTENDPFRDHLGDHEIHSAPASTNGSSGGSDSTTGAINDGRVKISHPMDSAHPARRGRAANRDLKCVICGLGHDRFSGSVSMRFDVRRGIRVPTHDGVCAARLHEGKPYHSSIEDPARTLVQSLPRAVATGTLG